MTMKTCTKCAENKPLDQFYRARNAKDGRDSRCIACEKARLAKWAADNPERRREAQARYNATDKSRDKQRRWRENNPERAAEVVAAFRERNPNAGKEATKRHYYADIEHSRQLLRNRAHLRRARMANNGVFGVTTKDIRRLLSQPCAYCGSTESPTVDHIIPIARGGRHSVGNLQCLCASCNFSKNDSLMVEFRYRKRKVAA